MSSPDSCASTMQPGCGFVTLPIEIGQQIAALLDDKDLASFRATCKTAHNAVEGDAGTSWRRRFRSCFETSRLQLTGRRGVDNASLKTLYQERKSVLHVIDQVFQKEGNATPKLTFEVGRRTQELVALRILRDLIIEAFSDKHEDDKGMEFVSKYASKNLLEIAEFTQKTNILKILGRVNKYEAAFKSSELMQPATSLLFAIQCVLAPFLFRFDDWHRHDQYGFHEAQMMAYSDNFTSPVLAGHTGQSVNMAWLLKNIQFWRHHFLTKGEPLSPFFEGLRFHELPGLWSRPLSQDKRELGHHWKGSYAFVNRNEIKIIRSGKSGQGNHPQIQDKLNGEEDPDAPFQSIHLDLASDDDSSAWNHNFEAMLDSLKTPVAQSRTRAQKSASGGASTNLADFATSSYRFDGQGTDNDEDFYMEGWLNPLPPQQGIPGWQRVTMMKYFVENNGNIDMAALWAYEGIMLPGGKIMIGRWWCPTDGVGPRMYSGPFILWNIPCTACVCENGEEGLGLHE